MAKFHIYQFQHVVLRRSEKLKNLGEIKQDREKVYNDTKEVISILGSLKAKNPSAVNLQCEQFLDYALMDYIRELNKRQSKDSIYCMLCHKKQAIVRSHIVPEAVLKSIFKKDQQMIVMGPSSVSLDSRLKTFRMQTFNMLCKTCDNEVLSRDENLFIANIVKPVYGTSPTGHLEKIDKIPYKNWLYRFCAGIIFRSLTLTRGVTGSTNAEKIHELFHYCRSVVKPSTQSDNNSLATAQSLKKLPASEEEFSIAMFFTPGIPEDQLPNQDKPNNLIRSLNSSIFQRLSKCSHVRYFP